MGEVDGGRGSRRRWWGVGPDTTTTPADTVDRGTGGSRPQSRVRCVSNVSSRPTGPPSRALGVREGAGSRGVSGRSASTASHRPAEPSRPTPKPRTQKGLSLSPVVRTGSDLEQGPLCGSPTCVGGSTECVLGPEPVVYCTVPVSDAVHKSRPWAEGGGGGLWADVLTGPTRWGSGSGCSLSPQEGGSYPRPEGPPGLLGRAGST